MAEYEVTGVGGKQAYTLNQTNPAVAYMKVDVRALPLAAGEDATNNVVRVEKQGEYETVAASQTDQVLGSAGAAGDYLEKLVLVVATAATAAVSIKDGAGSSIAVFPASPGGGVGAYVIPLDMISTAGAWSVTTGAGVSAIAVGRFT
jgi:hypothetical protein